MVAAMIIWHIEFNDSWADPERQRIGRKLIAPLGKALVKIP
jgi:hypothetical protein